MNASITGIKEKLIAEITSDLPETQSNAVRHLVAGDKATPKGAAQDKHNRSSCSRCHAGSVN